MLILVNACSQQTSSSKVVVPDIPQADQPSPSIDVSETVNTFQQENRIVTTALGDNKLVNPAFEQGTLGWTSCGGATGYSLTTDSVSGQAGKLSTGCFYQTVNATAGTQLSLSCKTKITDNSGWSGMGYGYTDSNFAVLEEAPVQTMSGSGFRDYSTTLTAPANTTYASVWVYTDGTVHVDDCSLSSGAPSAPQGNLLSNPSFTSSADWFNCGNANNWNIASGNLNLTGTACLYQTNNAQPNLQYNLSCTSKRGAGVFTEFILTALDDAYQNIGQEIGLIESTSFQSKQVSLTTPANTKYVAVTFYGEGSTNHQECSLTAGDGGTPPTPTNQAPSVSITAPSNGATLANSSNVAVTASASDSDGTISNVKLFLNNTLVAQDNTAPYEWGSQNTLQNLAAGDYTLRSEATDNDGATATDSVSFRIEAAATPASNGSGLFGHYVSRAPVTVQRTDANLNFNWGTGSPVAGINADNFSITWSGEIQPRYSGIYTFHATTDDGVRVHVNGELVVNSWVAKGPTEHIGEIELEANKKYSIVIDYYEAGGGAVMKFEWSSNQQAREVVPTSRLFPYGTAPSNNGTGLNGQYRNGIDLSTVYEKTDSTINFNWGTGAPAPSINADDFNITWRGEIQPRYSGTYTFHATSDDGVRLQINNQLVIDNWNVKSPTEHTGTISLQANQKYPIVLDYFERGGGAVIKLEWSSNQQAREVVPASQLFPSKTVVNQAGSKGQWSGVQSWPLIATHMANLKDGRVLAWSSYDANGFGGRPDANYTQATIFNPTNGTFQDVDNPTHDMFCAGLVTLSDGTVLAAGGGDGNASRSKVSIFNGSTWQRQADMPNPHWYGTAVVDADDNVLVSMGASAGRKTDFLSNNGTWKNLPGIDLAGTNEADLETPDWYPALHLSPRGTIFHAGPTTQMHEISTSGNGTATSRGNRNQDGVTDEVYRQWGNAIMIDEGKILMTGGTPKQSNPGSLNTNVIIDINGTNPVVTKIAPMSRTRTYQSTILLPDGEIMVLGGNGTGVEFNDGQSRLVPEIYNPTTNTWRDVAAMSVPRNYHSTATLLQDGRILTAGGGLCRCSADHQDGQIYSPAYLFNDDGSLAARPTISSAPSNIGYNQGFNVNVTGAGANNITRFNMIKFSANTHAVNSDLRQDVLSFTNQGNGSYRLTSDSNKNVVTPGYYYLFAMNSSGVPSVATIIQIR